MTSLEAAVRSREEDAELQRSTKKVKENHGSSNRTDNSSPRFGEGRNSYKERLTGDVPGLMNKPLGLSTRWRRRLIRMTKVLILQRG